MIKSLEKDDMQALEGNFFLRVVKFGVERPKGFGYNEITNGEFLKLEKWEGVIIDKYLEYAHFNAKRLEEIEQGFVLETPFLCKDRSINFRESSYVMSFSSYFKFIDYQELKFARETAREAKALSLRAIRISVAAIVVSALVPILIFFVSLFTPQTVRIYPDQLQDMNFLQQVQEP